MPPIMAVPGMWTAGPLAIRPDPPVGAADDPERRSTTITIPPGGLLCCFTDGLVERRDRVIDEGLNAVAATLDSQLASRASRDGRPVPLAEDASAAVMRALIGSARATDDVALLVAYRKPVQLPD